MAVLEDSEVLAHGAERSPRRWPWVAAAVLIALIALIRWYDGWQRERSLQEITIGYDAGISRVESGERQVQGIIEFVAPQQTSPTTPQRVRDDLDRMVQQTAGDSYAGVAEARQSLSATFVLPWQGDVATVRSAATDALDARASGLRTLAEIGEARYADRTVIDRLRLELIQALSAARSTE